MRKIFYCFIFLIFSGISNLVFAQTSDRSTINIVNARKTSYQKDKETGNDTIVLEGSVEISVTKGTNSTEINADKVTYDRQSEMLYAEGNVKIITKSGNSGGEEATASAILMNTATLEGVFDDGRVVQTKSDAINLPSGSTLVVFSDIFGKSKNNVIAFKNSSLTFCDDPDPHWRIDATRTWLLPGGEFAFFNALLYVGRIPILYFPAFYYPKDELIFNPVFAYDPRTGYSVQTTTYIIGRKPLNTSSSSSDSGNSAEESLAALYNFMKPGSLKEQVREGIVLHNLDEDYKGETKNYTKIVLDWYSNLGVMAGVDGKLSPFPTYISDFSFNFYAGLSRTVFNNYGGSYVPFSPSGKTYMDSSTFLGLTLPFRYGASLKFTLIKPFKMTLSLPIYSDPFFNNDFLKNREESMDWISYALASAKKDDSSTVSEVSSFSWSLSTSYNPVLPEIVRPYISSSSISTSSSINFSTMNMSEYDTEAYESSWKNYTPNRKFYYPSQIVPFNVTSSISGTIFEYPKKTVLASASVPKFPVELNIPEELKSPAQIQKEKEEAERNAKAEEDKLKNQDSAEEAGENQQIETDSEEDLDDDSDEKKIISLTFPELDHSVSLNSITEGLNYKLTYTINPTVTSQIAYASSQLKKSQDFDWKNIRSFMYTIKIPAAINSNFSYGGNFISLANKVSFEPVFQNHPYVLTYEGSKDTNGGYSISAADALKLADYKAESRNILNTNTLSFRPFQWFPIFSASTLSWNSTIKLFRREFIGDAENPDWENHGIEWDENSITVNSINLNLVAQEKNNKFNQSLTLSTVLPPLLRSYTATLNLTFPYVSTNFSCGFTEKTHDDVPESEKWTRNSLQHSATVSLLKNELKLSESFNFNINDEEKHAESLKVSAAWKGINLSYVMSYTNGYDLITGQGWKVRDKKEFLPYSLSLSYSKNSGNIYAWNKKIEISAGISTGINLDFIRATNSSFVFTPSINFKINDFFNLKFSSTSKNQVLYWYFHEGIYDEWGGFPGNMIKDLINSYRFDSEEMRLNSGFKLKSLNMSMSHDLHDWSFNFTMSVEPKLVTKSDSTRTYDFTPKVTIGIVWNPMQSIKSNLVYEYNNTEEKGIWSLEG